MSLHRDQYSRCSRAQKRQQKTKRKKFHPFRAVRKIFRWGSKVKRVKCSEGVSSEGGGIIASKKSLSVGELRQAALGDPLDPNMDLDAQSIDINDPTGLAVGGGGGCGVGAGGAGPGAGLYSMAGLSLSHDSVFSPDTSTPAEMGQIIHPVPVMTGISITNSLFKNELFNRVRARRAGEEDSEEEEDEDPGLPRSPCSHTPPNVGEHAPEGGLLLPCGGVIGPDGRVPGALGTHAGQHPLTGSIASILQHSSPGNKAKARSTCSAGSLSSMLSSETDEDSLSAGASNSQNSSAGVSGGGQGSGSVAVAGGGVDKGGQMSHNAARHKIAIKPKKNHGRRRPVRATPTEPSLPATPEERTTPSTADDEAALPPYNNQSLSNSNSAAELLDIETGGGSASAVSSRPMSTDEEVLATAVSPFSNLSTILISQKSSPLLDCTSNTITAGLSQAAIATGNAAADNRSASSSSSSQQQQQQQQQLQQEKRRSASALLDETPEPVVITPTSHGQTQMQSGHQGGSVSDQADLLRQSDVSPKRRPTGAVAMMNVQSIQGVLGTSRSLGSPVQRSKSMKTESADGFRTGQCQSELSPGGRPRGLRPVSQASGDLRPDLDVDARDNKAPLSAQNSPVKRGLNVSSDFFQRSKSFSAKVSETHQALGVRRRDVDEEKESKVTLAGRGGVGQSSAFATSGAKMGPTVGAAVAERPCSELLEGVELRRPRGVQARLSPDDACGNAQPNQQQQQQTTTSSFAGEPELFKVFARRSLKQKPGPHDEKQDTETEKTKVAARPQQQQQQQENKDKDKSKEGIAVGLNAAKTGIPQIRSFADAKRVSEPQVGQGIDHLAPTPLTSSPNLTSVELLPSKKELSKLKVGSNVISAKDKESVVLSSQDAGGPTSLPVLRREADQFRKQQSLAQLPPSYQSEPPPSSDGQVGPTVGPQRSLHTSASIVPTGGSQPQQQQPSGDKRASAILLQRASSVAVRGTEENENDYDPARTVSGTQDSGQPEWLRVAQKRREKRELNEKMDNTSAPISVAANNAANVHDTASNKLSGGNNSVSNQEASSAKPSAGLRSSKVLDLVSNFQKLQMA